MSNPYISYFGEQRSEVDDRFDSDGSDFEEREESLLREPAVQTTEKTKTGQSKHRSINTATPSKQKTQHEAPVKMQIIREDPTFGDHLNLDHLMKRMQKAELRHEKWKARAQRYRKKIRDQKRERKNKKSRKRKALDFNYDSVPTDGFGRIIKF